MLVMPLINNLEFYLYYEVLKLYFFLLRFQSLAGAVLRGEGGGGALGAQAPSPQKFAQAPPPKKKL